MKLKYVLSFLCVSVPLWFNSSSSAQVFTGQHFAGSGDVEYLQLLDTAGRQFAPDPELQNLSMLCEPKWNGLVEGPTWDAWWIQNSYGGTYAWLPFAVEPWATFIADSQKLWFDHQGDGKTPDKNGYVAPDGCLVDCANLNTWYYRQGDGRHDIHDWFMEATAAGVLLQGELLLISRDEAEITKFLPKLERAANFIETRRDPKTGLYLGGTACNLLAPSFAGYKNPDGTYGKAYHAGLQVTYIAALDRLIELEKLAGHQMTATAYEKRRDLAKQSLGKLVTDEGYFVNSIDPDGTKHGVFGAAKHGYFESSVNHDAIAFRVADDEQAKKIYAKIASIPQLRPHAVIIPNYPSYDDLYEINWALWKYGFWTNGGHWSTCEARMILAYYRLGKFDDAAASMKHMLKFARAWRMDNNLTDFGDALYQPDQPINITVDAFAPSAAMIRGLFEYLYKSDRLILIPHIPPKISRLEQKDPIRFGGRRLMLSTIGQGHVTKVEVNGQVWTDFTPEQITLPFDQLQNENEIAITLGYPPNGASWPATAPSPTTRAKFDPPPAFADRAAKLQRFMAALVKLDEAHSYEIAHARLALRAIEVISQRKAMLEEKKLTPLPQPASAAAAEKMYIDTATKLYDGLNALFAGYEKSVDRRKQQIAQIWAQL